MLNSSLMAYDILITVGGFVGFAVLHSLLANTGVKNKLFAKWPDLYSYYRLIYNAVSIFYFLGWIVFSPFPEGVLYSIPEPWSYLFYLLQATGVVGFIYSLRATDTMEFLGIKQLRTDGQAQKTDPQPLVTDGIFGLVRHPLYTSTMMVLIFYPDMSHALALFTVLCGLYFWIGSYYEEQNLVDLYGQEYVRYRKEVPRFIPKLGIF